MTNDELAQLKQLAQSCYVFGKNDDSNLADKEQIQLANNNGEFFEKAVMSVPKLVDELLTYRNGWQSLVRKLVKESVECG